MTTEKAIQEGIQGVIRGISIFDDDSVQISNDVFLDGPLDYSPFFNIVPADNFNIRMDTRTATGSYEVTGILYVEFRDWQQAQDDFRDARQAIVDEFNEVGTARSAGGIDGVDIDEIRSDGPIAGMSYSDDPDQTFPVYLMQAITFMVNIYG